MQVLINEFCQAEKIKIISEGTPRALKPLVVLLTLSTQSKIKRRPLGVYDIIKIENKINCKIIKKFC
ncbi:MAG: hypothetical protein C0626_11905 [Arcobacter sp.]|nr:MAG: hypothetical protein C0626_11905 [Arcobacter sp.]